MRSAIVALLALAGSAAAQPTQSWVDRINGSANSNDNTAGIATDPQGNAYVVGWTAMLLNDVFMPQMTLAKYAPDGTRLWLRTYALGDQSIGSAVAVDPADSSVVITGRAGLTSPWVTVKYDTNGNKLWERFRTAETFFIRVPTDLVVDASGNVWTLMNDQVNEIATVIVSKFSATGEALLMATYDEQGVGAYANDLEVNSATGEFYTTGSVGDGNTGPVMMSVTKFSASGARLWMHPSGHTDGFVGNAGMELTRDAQGNIIAGGDYGLNSLTRNIGLVKLSPAGATIWSTEFNSPTNDDEAFYSMDVHASGAITICGGVELSGTGYDPLLLKFNADGTLAWDRTTSGGANAFDVFHDVKLDAAGNAYAVGDFVTPGLSKAYIAKYTPAGLRVWEHFYVGPGNNPSRWKHAALVGDAASPSILATGDSFGPGVGQDLTTIKLTQPVVPPNCPADFNGDLVVNAADLSVLLATFGTAVTPGTGADSNDDGVVNSADLSTLLGSFGASC